jgi:hypothetical protein
MIRMRGGRVCSALVCTFGLALSIPLGAAESPERGAPSATTRARLDAAVVPLNERNLNAAYQFHSRFVTGKPDGEVLEERVEVWAVDRSGPPIEGPPGRLLSAKLDGEDITEERRDEVTEQRRAAAGNDPDEDSGSAFVEIVDLLLPGEKDGDLYAFQPEPRDGDTCAAQFEPRGDSEVPDRAARGVLRWNCETHEPLRLEATRIETPPLVDKVFIEWDFETVAGVAYPKHYRLVVEGGVLFVKRRYEFAGSTEDFTAYTMEAIE